MCFARARERLSPDQMHFAVVLDAFIQSYARYLQAQQALHMASKRFVEADAEQQTQLVALEKLLSAIMEDTDRVPQPHAIAKAPKVSWEKQSPQSLQLPSPIPTMSSRHCHRIQSPKTAVLYLRSTSPASVVSR